MRSPPLNLSTKGVIYILVPALIQLLCLSGLMLLVNQEQLIGERDSHFEEVAGRTNWLCVLVSSSVAAKLAYLETGSASAEKLCRDAASEIPVNVAALKDSLSTEPILSGLLEKAQPDLNALPSYLAPATKADAARRLTQFCEQSWPRLFVLRRFLLRGENTITSQKVDSSAHLPVVMRYSWIRQGMKNVIAVLMLFTVASAFVVIYRFGQTIAGRLAITAENTRRLSQGIKLNQPLDGGDEIAQLDRSFHSMADALAKAQQLRQEYISMISHDIRTPLSSVYGSIEYLEMGYGGKLTEKGEAMVERALRNLERVLSMINSMLIMEQLESGMTDFDLIEVDMQKIIDSSIASVQDLAAKQDVKVTSTAPPCMVIIDDQRTIQVLVNLLGNALKFSPEHSSIVVSSIDRQDKLEVRVTDQGRGIPPDLVDKIFDRFQQVERNDQTRKGGVGLGLAICKAIVHGQGGEIGVTSEVGKGSTFWFTVSKVSDSAGAKPA